MSVELFGVMVGHPSVAALDAVLEQATRSPVSYGHVGSTLTGGRRSHLDVGTGRSAFERAVEGLRSWVPQRGIGAAIHPSDAAVVEGTTVVVVLRLGPFTVLAPDRIVKVIDQPGRFAFAYGTLPGHPERGEESFCVELLADETVRLTVAVDASPGTMPARLAAPAVRLFQRRAVRQYLASLAQHVAR